MVNNNHNPATVKHGKDTVKLPYPQIKTNN